ncbi:MAG: hypothetical protein IM638_11845 [Bacteroidetes bacterium]|nr:hypothetical protein [Bacteroidota bacterium]
MLRNLFFAGCMLGVQSLVGQDAFTTVGTPYTQNFNTLPNTTDGAAIAGWANNTYLTGWYVSTAAPVIEASCGPTAGSVNNTGAVYVIASGTDRNLGSRASGGSGTLRYGVRLVNATGSALTSIYVRYYGEQWSIAENGTNVNTIAFSYQTGTTVTSLTTGTWTSVSALNFTQIYTSSQSAGLGGSACAGTGSQCLALNGNSSANRVLIEACITVSVAAGNEIFLRWEDIDNAANDHHLQIDDLEVWPLADPCATVLPVEFTSFTATLSHNRPMLRWETATETNNARFEIQRSADGEVFETTGSVAGAGTTTQPQHYSYYDISAPVGILYYRLKQIDYNGEYAYSEISVVEVLPADKPVLYVSTTSVGIHYELQRCNAADELEVWNASGQLLYRMAQPPASGTIPLYSNGLFVVRVRSGQCAYEVAERILFTAQ